MFSPRNLRKRPQHDVDSQNRLRIQRNFLAALVVFLIVAGASRDGRSISDEKVAASASLQALRSPSASCALDLGTKYKGPKYFSSEAGSIGQPKCLVESKWMRLSQHSVRFPGASSAEINDWLWIDYHDRINVLVMVDGGGVEPHFHVFQQTKYALEGRQSSAIIGGIIEPGEAPQQAARRETEEELGMRCDGWHALGRFRTDVNRGMGWLHPYLASGCAKYQGESDSGGSDQQIGAADQERQDVRVISLEELKKEHTAGMFLEVQWSATIGLALQHEAITKWKERKETE